MAHARYLNSIDLKEIVWKCWSFCYREVYIWGGVRFYGQHGLRFLSW